ncbi:MAG: methyltransferase type 12 [Chlorobi bacterium]|nr:methyltransferase type 12 [Chlorobiota bacterium]
MLLTITNTRQPATDLGYLLHKHPARAQTFDLTFGSVHLFYPEATEERCTCSLLLDVDPIKLVRGRRKPAGGFALEQYVNDRPYVASSFMSVGIAEVLTSALNGKCRDRPELVDELLPLIAGIHSLPCRGGERIVRGLFEPLGYAVTVERLPLDPAFPEWGESGIYNLTLSGTVRLRDLLAHLYVLIPVLDDEKHYWVGDDEVEKLLHRGEGWLAGHPERDLIARRYLRHQGSLARNAVARLAEGDTADPDESAREKDKEEADVEVRIGLHQQRLEKVVEVLKESGAARVLDAGCGEGKLLRMLVGEKEFTEILGMDVSSRALEMASARMEKLPEKQRERVKLIQGALTYRDRRIAGYDAAAIVEVIEHLDADRLVTFEQAIFKHARPGTVVITTPNSEYNVMWPSLSAGRMRHRDHRFEWTRGEFEAWATRVAGAYGYSVRFLPVGPEDAAVGAPTQMGVFSR